METLFTIRQNGLERLWTMESDLAHTLIESFSAPCELVRIDVDVDTLESTETILHRKESP